MSKVNFGRKMDQKLILDEQWIKSKFWMKNGSKANFGHKMDQKQILDKKWVKS